MHFQKEICLPVIEVVLEPTSPFMMEHKEPAPQFGQHTEEILLELGYDWDFITRMKDEEVI